ncbi:MAG: hypothetical protein SGI83_02030 [Bacteroidota bacterium]|nr:hypothetical protein [Bacteroidota bacterium]
MLDLSVTNNSKRKIIKAGSATWSLGLVIPFQPSMQNERTIQTMLTYVAEIVQTKLQGSYNEVYIYTVLASLEKVFSKLNYNSHCKSIAVILTPEEEKVTYLNFRGKPVTFLNKYVSLLELASITDREPEFYFLLLQETSAEIFEYHNNQLHKVYAQKQKSGCDIKNNTGNLIKGVLNTIELLNSKNDKPVFVTGIPALATTFYKASSIPETVFKIALPVTENTSDKMQLLAAEIARQWKYWQSKFTGGKIILAQRANYLVSNVEAVLQALRRSVDGLLLIDKRLKQQLYKSRRINALYNTGGELMNQIERFLVRGNRIEITETGLQKNFGGIVLLQSRTYGSSERQSIFRQYERDRPGLIF